jgi:quinohemoprotein ethanol dehydrogenase
MKLTQRLSAALWIGVAMVLTTAPTFGADANWPNYGQTTDETHFSDLAQIDTTNAARLGLAWSFDLNTNPTNTTPLAIDGVLYVAAGYSIVHAFDAVTGKLLWRYDPKAALAAGEKLRYAWGIRGLAYASGKLIVGTIDGRLIALDAKSGKLAWSTLTVDPKDALNITGIPRVMGDKVIIGNGGADMGPVRGYVTAYEVRTGKQAWRFYTVPGDPKKERDDAAMAMAAKTWSGEWWKDGGGGTAWSGMTYDAELGQVYIGVGNGGPWNWKIRNPEKKDNLFLASIVALDANTGRYRWHYQVNPNDAWDFSAAMDMVLATLPIDGQPRKVLMQAPKNGFLYVLDRATGKVISAEKLVRVTWADRIDIETGRPVERPGIRYESGSTTVWPSYYGGHNWQPMAYSPKRALLYIPTLEMPATWSDRGIDPATWTRIPGSINSGLIAPIGVPGHPEVRDTSKLVAWDPALQREIWAVPTTDGQNAGVMATAGDLVFQGETSGTFNAYNAANGRRLWSYNAGVAITGSPITYTVGGKQYVAVIASPPVGPQSTLARRAGWTWSYREHPRRLLVFALDANASLPSTPPHHAIVPLKDDTFKPDAALVTQGEKLYGDYACRACHGSDAISGGGAPDLRASAIPLSAEAFRSVVHDGALVAAGMPRFAEFSEQQVEAIRHYLRKRAVDDLASGTVRRPVMDVSN